MEHDLGNNYNVDPAVGVNNQWYEINNYLMYKVNDCLSYGGRFEWFQDPQGARVSAGSLGNYYAVTDRIQLQAARQHDDPAGTPLRLVQRLRRKHGAAVQQQYLQQPTVLRDGFDFHVLVQLALLRSDRHETFIAS